jgi:hypothetical protein
VAGLALGGTLSATAAWLLAGLLQPLPHALRVGALVAVTVAVAGQELGLLRLRLPSAHRQVPREVFDNGPYASALQFGVELGTGVRTYLPSAVPYALLAAVLLLQPSFPAALLAGACFGLGRAAMTLSRTASADAGTWDALLRRRLVLVQPAAAAAGIVLCLVLAG